MYNTNNIFYKILKKEVPAKIIHETETIICFYDINPKSKVHALVIPKKEVIDFDDFIKQASQIEVASFFKDVQVIAKDILKLNNFKILTNNGSGAGQEVFHFHIHIMGY
jgi:histidine triad (HIT) family protein